MVQIVAYKCQDTGRIFEDPAEYQRHRQRLRNKQTRQAKLLEQQSALNEWWATAYNREMDISEWPAFVIENQEYFWREAARIEGYQTSNPSKIPDIELLTFDIFDVKWSDLVSNTHCRPHNGVENWMCDKNKPLGYPGWVGLIEFTTRRHNNCTFSGSSLFRGRSSGAAGREYTGTGGGNRASKEEQQAYYKPNYTVYNHRYDFRIFVDDWPGMARYREEQSIVNILCGTKVR